MGLQMDTSVLGTKDWSRKCGDGNDDIVVSGEDNTGDLRKM